MPDDQGREFCIDCGAEIPDEASFCPECGEEIDAQDDDKNSETKLSQIGDAVQEGYDAVKDNYDTVTDDQSIRQEERDDIEERERELYNKAKRLVNDAEGDIDPAMLIATREEKRSFWLGKEINLRLYNPLISYLDEGEQPHHLLYTKNGAVLSVLRPEEDETTILPDRDDYSYDEQSDYSFLMATDKRLLYIAADDGQDYLWEFDYSDIYMIHNDNIGISDTLKFYTTDQCEYSYPLIASIGMSDWSDAIDYIKEKAELDEKRLLGHFWLRTKGKIRSAIQEIRSQS